MLEKNPEADKTRKSEKTYLEGLGATWDDFRGKKVLDVGALDVAFARAAKVHDVEVVALDRKSDKQAWRSFGVTPRNEDAFVQANAELLPFKDGSFDAVVSHAGPFTGADEQRELEARFREAWRVLRPGGELRLGRTLMSLDKDEERTAPLPERAVPRQNILQARSRALLSDILKKIPFEIAEFRMHKRSKDGYAYCHYVLRKPLVIAGETAGG